MRSLGAVWSSVMLLLAAGCATPPAVAHTASQTPPSVPVPAGVTPTSATAEAVHPQPTPDPETASWKRYANLRHSYSFRYPPTWDFGDYHPARPSDEEFAMADHIAVYAPPGEAYGGLVVDVYMEPHEPNGNLCAELPDCVVAYNELHNSSPGYEVVEDEGYLISGQKAVIQRVERREHGWVHWQAFILMRGNFYLISFTAELDTLADADRMFEEILSTFAFTE
jgi:hypothetical protein